MSRRSLACGLAAALAVTAALAWIEWNPEPRRRVGDELRYLERAEQLAAGEEVAPDLLWPPLYSRLLAFLLWATGSSRGAVVLFQLALLGITAWLVRDLTARLAGPATNIGGAAADLAGLSVLVYPPLVAFAFYLWPEVVHLALFAFVLWVLAARPAHRGWLAAAGFALGLALLTKSLLGPFLPVLLLPVALQRPRLRALASAALVAAVAAATVLPTIVAHGRQTGSFVIADSSLFNLWLGLGDTSRKDYSDRRVVEEHAAFLAGGDTFSERNQALGAKIRQRIDEQGWLATLGGQLSRQHFRLFDKDSLLTDQLPGGALAARGRGYRRAPASVAWPLRGGSYALYAVLLAAAPFGLALHPPGRRPWEWVLPAFFAYNLVLFVGLHVKSRYVVPLLPGLTVYAACALATLADAPGRRRIADLPRWKLAAAGLAAAGLVVLAFGRGAFGGDSLGG